MEIASDKRHRDLLSKLLDERMSLDSEIKRKGIYHLEYYYNHYGQRGFIDLLEIQNNTTRPVIDIYEVKPSLENLGEAMRQLNRALDAIKKIGLSGVPHSYTKSIRLILVTELCSKNYNIIIECKPMLINTNITILLNFNNEWGHFFPCIYEEYDLDYIESLNRLVLQLKYKNTVKFLQDG